MQNRLDPVLQTGYLRDELRPFRDHATARRGLFVGHPHFGHGCVASTAASILSVVTFAQAMARTTIGLAMTTRPTKGESKRTITLVLPVASTMISSSSLSLSANCNRRLQGLQQSSCGRAASRRSTGSGRCAPLTSTSSRSVIDG